MTSRGWPNSTVDISELRLVIDYQRQNGADRTLTLDIVDYPGEWLLDLPLLNKSYTQWSRESVGLSRQRPRAKLAEPWHAQLATLDAVAREDEQAAKNTVRNLGGGEVRIQGENGRWRDSDTVAPGNDPFPPRDSKH